MKRDDRSLDPELEALLKPRWIQRRVPADLRARALANGRAIVAAGGTITAPHLMELPAPRPLPVARSRRLFRVALAASVAVALGAIGAVAALYNRSAHTPSTPSPASSRPDPVVDDRPVPAPSGEPPAVAAARAAPSKPNHSARASAGDDGMTVELALLQRAHAAYTRHDFSGALTLVAEHARRFPKGHLAEQREALRVRSLVGSGRTEEAHRAAAAFAVRFPRSVLLPRLEGGPDALE
jgi:hypothetical protein